MAFQHSLLLYLQHAAQGQNLWATAVLVFLGTLAVMLLKSWWDSRNPASLEAAAVPCGDITATELAKYNGGDPFKPIYVAIRGKVYDVSKAREMYGPGGSYAVFAGRETARALATMSTKAEDCTPHTDDLSEEQRKVLADWVAKFQDKYTVVGKVVAPKRLTLEELRGFDGSHPTLPILLAIRGTIFDVTSGKEFYGPDGIYPFAGRECARAFALVSTDTADCNDDLSGLGAMELDNLRDWEAKFHFKYPVVGSVTKQ